VEVVKRQFGMIDSKSVTSDNYIDVNHRVIWTNDNYDEWEACMLIDYPDEETREEEGITIDYERYHEDCDQYLDDERANLDIEVDGCIVAFVDLGLWDGRHNGVALLALTLNKSCVLIVTIWIGIVTSITFAVGLRITTALITTCIGLQRAVNRLEAL
jgi:hypothetical protein